MRESQFEQVFQQLPKRRKEVLKLFLAGVTDDEIAQRLKIGEGTVRSHIRNLCDNFGLENEFEDDQTPRRGDLIALFKQYKPELVKEETPDENPPQPQFDPDFVGRDEAMADLDCLVNEGQKCILILSPGGRGKTTLAWRYLKSRFAEDDIIYFPIAKETKDIASIETLVEERLKQLGEEPGREFLVSLERLRDKLASKPMGVLIDNLEPALDESNRFVEQHRSYIELFKQVLLSPQVQAVTLITSRSPLKEGLDIRPYELKSLSVAAWQQYFEHWQIEVDTDALEKIHQTYQGNTLAMRVLLYPIQNDYQGDLTSYWQDCQTEDGVYIEDPVLNLIREQFDLLAKLHPHTYNLLCRMGCYRYQAVDTIPKEGLLCLLWDIPKPRRQQTIRALQDRSLIDVVKGEFRLHPAIRAEALERLRKIHEWEKANNIAAAFWDNIIDTANIKTDKEAIRKLESVHHYIACNNWNPAILTLIGKEEDNSPTLVSILRSLGYIQSCIELINLLIKHSNQNYNIPYLHTHAGDLYFLVGNLERAFFHYDTYLKKGNWSIHSFHGIDVMGAMGYLYLVSGDEMKALELFEVAVKESKEYNYKDLYVYILSCMCLIYLHQNRNEEVEFYLSEATKNQSYLLESNTTWARSYGLYNLGKVHLLLNKDVEAVFFFESIKYKGNETFKLLLGLKNIGLAQVNRNQKKVKEALSNHFKSIDLLKQIGAKCDLAEAHYQLALTYQAMNEPKKPEQEHFDEAIKLWEEIGAPKQIERIRKSMNSSPD